MPTNNFKLFDEKKANMMTDEEYAINQQRLNGVQSGVASSQLQNKTLYQTALMCYALAQLMAANGYDANDADAVSTFVNNLSRSFVQKVSDKATENEATAGTIDNKYISPATLKAVKPKYGANDPTTTTVGFLGQIYINTTTNRAYLCVKIDTGVYTWEKIPNYHQVTKTEIITESSKWTVPSGVVGNIFVRLFGAGAGGGGHMATGNYTIEGGTSVDVTIGAGASHDGNGGASSFGTYLTAQGATGINGGSGGGASSSGGGSTAGSAGGTGSYGGGGGGGAYYGGSGFDGGAGGIYGGGGGGGAGGLSGNGGAGGTYGGAGGRSGKAGSAGTNTVGMGLEFEGEGKGGIAGGPDSYGGGGGGGGYGGNGGAGGISDTVASPGGGGGGYGADGGAGGSSYGSSRMGGAGGGGGYGGRGGNGEGGVNVVSVGCGGGGGGYGKGGNGADGGRNAVKSSYAAGTINVSGSVGGDGVCVITYTVLEVQ